MLNPAKGHILVIPQSEPDSVGGIIVSSGGLPYTKGGIVAQNAVQELTGTVAVYLSGAGMPYGEYELIKEKDLLGVED